MGKSIDPPNLSKKVTIVRLKKRTNESLSKTQNHQAKYKGTVEDEPRKQDEPIFT